VTRRAHGIIVRPRAEADITDAVVWYERQRPDLGREFLGEVRANIPAD
jgi:hypothetical protein